MGPTLCQLPVSLRHPSLQRLATNFCQSLQSGRIFACFLLVSRSGRKALPVSPKSNLSHRLATGRFWLDVCFTGSFSPSPTQAPLGAPDAPQGDADAPIPEASLSSGCQRHAVLKHLTFARSSANQSITGTLLCRPPAPMIDIASPTH